MNPKGAYKEIARYMTKNILWCVNYESNHLF